MSEVIVRMEMPKNGCSECRLKYKRRGYGGVFYCFNHLCVDKWTYERTRNGDRPSWCPIIGVLPEQHGDLIDREQAIATAVSGLTRTLPTTEGGGKWIRVSEVRESIKSVPTIVPATERRR